MRRKSALLVVSALVATFAGTTELAGWTPQVRPPTTVVLPDLLGRPQAEAEQILAELRIAPVTVRDTVVAGAGSGVVVRQLPPAGTRAVLPVGATLWVTRSPRLVDAVRPRTFEAVRPVDVARPPDTVPNVRGMHLERGHGILAALGLEVAVESIQTDQPPGTILRQIPAPGTVVEPGALARLWVATTTIRPGVPEVIGEPLEVARRAFNEVGIQVESVHPVPVDPKASRSPPADGSVVRQFPEAGTVVEAGIPGQLWVVTYAPDKPDQLATPDVLGLGVAEAVERMERAGIPVQRVVSVASDAAEGTVVEQRPPPGFLVDAGTEAALAVAQGPRNTRVPDLVGGSLAEAKASLDASGLGAASVSEVDSGEPSGTVVRQSPEPGATVPVGSLVDLVLSVGPAAPRRIEIPSVVGVSVARADEILGETGLSLGTVEGTTSDAPQGTVVDQWPPAGMAAAAGDAVGVRVSTGSPLEARSIAVPDVTGLAPADAVERLMASGLQATDQSEGEDGALVADQFPAPGTQVPPGTPVLLTLQAQTATPWMRILPTWGLPAGVALFLLLRLRRARLKPKGDGEDEPPEKEDTNPPRVEMDYRSTRRSPLGRVEASEPLLPTLEIGLRAQRGRAPRVRLETPEGDPLSGPSEHPDKGRVDDHDDRI